SPEVIPDCSIGKKSPSAAVTKVSCRPSSRGFVRRARRVTPSRRAAGACFPPVYSSFSRLAVVRMSPHHHGRLAHQAGDLQRLAEHAVQFLQVQRLAQVIVGPFRVRRGTVSSRAVQVARGGTRRAYSGSASPAPTVRVT